MPLYWPVPVDKIGWDEKYFPLILVNACEVGLRLYCRPWDTRFCSVCAIKVDLLLQVSAFKEKDEQFIHAFIRNISVIHTLAVAIGPCLQIPQTMQFGFLYASIHSCNTSIEQMA